MNLFDIVERHRVLRHHKNRSPRNGRQFARRHAVHLEQLEERRLLAIDLRPTALAVEPTVAQSGNGDQVEVNWTVANHGADPTTNSWTDIFYLSDDEILDPGDTLTGSFEISETLAGGGDQSFTHTIDIANHAAGSRFLLIAVNEAGAQPESNAANNVLAVPLELTTPDADLAISDMAIDGRRGIDFDILVSAGQTIGIFWSFINSGADDAGSARIDTIYLSSDNVLDGGDTPLHVEPFADATTPSGFFFGFAEVTLPSAIGTQYLIVEVDSGDDQAETDENNNTALLEVRFTDPLPDLTPIFLDLSMSEVLAGDSVNLFAEVRNIGAASANGFVTDGVYLSTDEVWDESDIPISSEAIEIGDLGPAQSYFPGLSFEAPLVAPGSYFILYVVDGPDEFEELDEANNLLATPIEIRGGDLAVSSFMFMGDFVLGATIGVSYTITNIGSTTINDPWFDQFYLSNDPFFSPDDVELGVGKFFFDTPLGPGEMVNLEHAVELDHGTPGPGKYLIAVTGQLIGDTNFGDNVAAILVDVTAPDLAVTSVTPPAELVVGETVSVGWTVENVGSIGAVGDWADVIYLSADTTLDGGDTFVGSATLGPLAVGQHYDASRSFQVPSVPAGSYYLLVQAAGFGQPDSDPSNNVLAVGPFSIGTPDLTVSSGSAPTTAIMGQTIEVTYRIDNIGGATTGAPNWLDRFYLSADMELNAGDSLLSSSLVSAELPLGPGEGYDRVTSVPLTNGTAGAQYLLIVVDSTNSQGESDETNNVLALPITTTAPDLTVITASAPSVATLQQTFEVSFTVTNTGDVPAPGVWDDWIWISEEPTGGIVGGDTFFLFSESSSANIPLAPGASIERTIEVTIPGFLTPGTKYLRFIADGDADQPETNENNNTIVMTIEILPVDANLVPTELVAPELVVNGTPFDIDWTVANQGTSVAPASWLDRVYLSDDDEFDAGDLLLGSASSLLFSPLAAGNDYSQSISVTLDGVSSGDKYLILVADDNERQPENNETDNILVRPITVGAGINLVVDSIAPPMAANFDESFDVTYTVRNDGNGEAGTGGWSDRVVAISEDGLTTIVLADVAITLATPLGPDESYTRTVSVSVPTSTAGNYRIGVDIDVFNEQAESDEGNLFTSVLFPMPPVPDLEVTSLVAPVDGYTGQAFLLTWTVTNNATVPTAAPWSDRVTLTGPVVVDLGTFEFLDTLGPGASVTRTELLTFPGVAGEYTVEIETDTFDAINEGPREDNNTTTSGTISVQPAPLPDLIITELIVPPDGTISGSTVSVTFTVMNVGVAATQAPIWKDFIFLSPDPGITYPSPQPDDNEISRIPYEPIGFLNPTFLNPGESYTQTVEVPVPLDSAGPWYFYVLPNGVGQLVSPPTLSESDRTNNLFRSDAVQIDLLAPPDLIVSDVITPLALFSGQPATIEWVVNNVGPGDTVSTQWRDRVYLSIDDVLDESDVLLFSPTSVSGFTHVGRLGAGESYRASQSVVLPEGISGDYYILVSTDDVQPLVQVGHLTISDDWREVFEAGFDDNNVGSALASVNLTPPPDLEVDFVTAPSAALSSHKIEVSYQVTNRGSSDTPSVTWRDQIYLSTDQTLDGSDVLLSDVSSFSGVLAVDAGYTRTRVLTVPDGLVGDFFVLVVSNADETVFELDRANNVSVSSAMTIDFAPPDLVVTDLSVDPTTVTGVLLSATWTVANQGVGDTAATRWIDKVYVSTDGTTTGGRLLGLFIHDGLLGPGGTYTRTATVTIPVDVTGPVGLYVETDAVVAFGERGFGLPATGPTANVYEGTDEDNNTSALAPFTVSRTSPDLVVSSLTAPASAEINQPVTINWTVENQGGQTFIGGWTDDVYLSLDEVVSADDILLGSVFRAVPLGAGGSYSATLNKTIPIGVPVGSYHFLVQTDRTLPRSPSDSLVNRIAEGAGEGNNLAVSAVNVGLGAVPDLVVSSVDVPTTTVAGRTLTVNWDVTNNGAATGNVPWFDAVYLSFDQVLDTAHDRLLGTMQQNGGLGAGGSYSVGKTFDLPPGVTGPYYVFVRTDATNLIFEATGETNNSAFDPQPVDLLRGQPVDFVVGSITVPATATSGLEATIGYSVENLLSVPVIGGWTDGIYFSLDDVWDASDVLFAQVNRTTDLSPGEGYSETVTAPLPALTPGNYQVIIRTDVRNHVAETDETNNIGVSLDLVDVGAIELELGTPRSDPLVAGGFLLYQVDATAGQTLRFSWDSDDDSVATSFFVRRGQIPTRSRFDFASRLLFEADHTLLVPVTRSDTYYILVHASTGPADGTVLVESIPFSVQSVSPGQVGNAGPVTLEIDGALFTRGTTFELVAGDGRVIPASLTLVLSAIKAYASFDLAGAEPGSYDVRARATGVGEAVAEDAVEVAPQLLAGNLETGISVPSVSLERSLDSFFITFANTSQNDVIAPLLTVRSPTNTLFGVMPQFMFAGRDEILYGASPEGPAGVLRPGQSVTVPFSFQSGDHDTIYRFELLYVDADDTTPIDWSWVESQLYFNVVAADDYPKILAGLQSSIGSTMGDYVRMLSRNANLAPTVETARDENALLNMEVERVIATLRTSLSGRIQTDDLDVAIAGQLVAATNLDTDETFVTTSLQDGSFLFAALSPGTYGFDLNHAVVPPGQTIIVGTGEHVAGFSLIVERGVRLEGRVLAGLAGVANALVSLVGEDGATAATTSDAQGNFSLAGLPPGFYRLSVTADGYARFLQSNLDLTAGDGFRTVSLAKEAVLTGKVTLAATGPTNTEMTVLVTSTDPDAPPFAVTTALKSFTFDSLPAGTYDIQIDRGGFVVTTIEGFAINAGQTVDLGTIFLEHSPTISGQVVSTDPNTPAGFAKVQILDGTTVVAVFLTAETGAFSIDGFAPGTYVVTAVSEAGIVVPVTVTVAAGEEVNVELNVHAGATIAGTVELAGKEDPIAGIPVFLALDNELVRATLTDGDGFYLFPNLDFGDYTVYLGVEGPGSSQAVEVETDDIDGSLKPADLVAGATAEIIGQLRTPGGQPIGAGTVYLLLDGTVVSASQIDGLGFYRFLLQQSGTFDLRVTSSHGTFAAATGLVVGASDTVVQDFIAGDASLTVTVTLAGEPVANAFIRLVEDTPEGAITLVTALTNEAGSATLEQLIAGNYRVEAFDGPGNGATSPVTLVDATTELLELALTPQGSVSGTVTNATGAAISGAEVAAYDSATGRIAAVTVSDEEGRYELLNLPDGDYDLVAFADGFVANVQTVVTIAGETTLDLTLSVSTGQITMTILDSSSNVVRNAGVLVTDSDGRVIGAATVDAAGLATVNTAFGTNLTLTASAPGYQREQFLALNNPVGGSLNLGVTSLAPVALGASQFGPVSVEDLSQVQLANATISPQALNVGSALPWLSALASTVQIVKSFLETGRNLLPEQMLPECSMCETELNEYTFFRNSYFVHAKQAEEFGEEALKAVEKFSEEAERLSKELTEQYVRLYEALQQLSALTKGDVARDTQQLLRDIVPDINNLTDTDNGAGVALSAHNIRSSIVGPVRNSLYNLFSDGQSINPDALGPARAALQRAADALAQLSKIDFSEYQRLAEQAVQRQALFEQEYKDALGLLEDAKHALLRYQLCLQEDEPARQNRLEEKMDDDGEGGGMSGGEGGGIAGRRNDPNDIIGPAGYADPRYVPASSTLDYTIQFENLETATLPVQNLTITHQLDADLDFRTVRFGDFGWGNVQVDVATATPFLNERVDLTATLGIYVDVFATIDVTTGLATWTMQAIDPATGQEPVSELVGFLPPNTDSGIGDGFVTYSVRPKSGLTTGDVIDAQATIIFDTEPPLDTPMWSNTLDADLPTSQVSALPVSTNDTQLAVSWSAGDFPDGSGLATTTIYVSVDGGAFKIWLVDASGTGEGLFEGQPGHSYAFFSVAADNAGNRELAPLVPDAFTTIASVNHVPTVVTPIANVTVDEDAVDTVVDVSGAFDDVDIATNGDSLTFTVEGNTNSSLVTANLIGSTLSLDYLPNQHGTATITVRATDLAGEWVEDTFTVNVNAVNDVPVVVTPIVNVAVNEDAVDTVIDISGAFDDVDIATSGDSLTFTVEGNTNSSLVIADLIGSTLSLDYLPNQHGTATITVRATDLAGEWVETSFLVTVTAVGVELPFSDDFNRANGTSLGDNWIETLGDVGIASQHVVLLQNTESTALLADLSVTDVSIRADVDLTGAEVGRSVALMARSQGPGDANAYWGIYFRSDSGYAAQIYKNIGGVPTPLRSVNVPGPAGNLRFEVFGTTLNLYFNDSLVTSVIDDALLGAGAVGLRQTGGALDNFAATIAVPPLSESAVLPFSDSFDRPDNSLFGAVWTERSGDTGIRSNAAALYANDTSVVTLNGVHEADVSVSADIDITDVSAQFSSGLLARYSGPGDANTYMARLFRSDSGNYAAQIWKSVNGQYTPLRSVFVSSGAGNLRFEVVGDQLQLFFNNSLVASTIDTSILGPGQVGMRLAGGTLDNFVAAESTLEPKSEAELPFVDNFSRSDGSSLGEFWSERAGDLGLLNEHLVLIAGETSVATLNGVSTADVDVSANVDITSGGNAGLLARYSGPGDFNAYLGLLQPVAGGTFAAQIWKNTGSSWENLTHSPINAGAGLLRFLLEGSQLQLFFDDLLVGDVLDSSITAPGSVGVRQGGGTVDDFSASLPIDDFAPLLAEETFDGEEDWAVEAILEELLD